MPEPAGDTQIPVYCEEGGLLYAHLENKEGETVSEWLECSTSAGVFELQTATPGYKIVYSSGGAKRGISIYIQVLRKDNTIYEQSTSGGADFSYTFTADDVAAYVEDDNT